MKKIVSVLAIAAAMLVAGGAKAQISINAGYMSQQHKVSVTSLTDEFKQDTSLNGGFLGLTYNLPLFAGLSLAPGAYVGYSSVTQAVENGDFDATTTDISLKVPVLVNLKIDLGSMDLLVFAGPTFDIGVSTIANYSAEADDINEFHKNMGGTVGAGLQFGLLRLFIGYNAAILGDDFDITSTDDLSQAFAGSNFFAGLGLRL